MQSLVTLFYIQPRKPTRNTYIGQFNRKARHKLLGLYLLGLYLFESIE